MAEQYWIGGFFIDLSRNQITQNQHSQTLAPKALAVLTYLAENQGKVISHDELLTKVWQDSVVSPNTLQKSIAQLRKALGDDGTVQVYIKTHAKQGYSLECDVRWQTQENNAVGDSSFNNFEEQTVDATNVNEVSSDINTARNLRVISIFAGIIFLSTIGYLYLAPKQTSQLTFDSIRPLTATDDKEFGARYTSDGQYIVFNRYLDGCTNKLWAKNISTQEEIQLTKDWGAYGWHSFSKDGKELVFLATQACGAPATQKTCYDLVSLDFEKALKSPQQPSLMLQCRNSELVKPIWLNNNNIALLQKKSNLWRLISYSISENKSIDLYNYEEGSLIDFAYSSQKDLLAVSRIHSDGQQYIEMLKPGGRLLSSHPVQLPHEIPKFRKVYPNFSPLNEQLIFSTGKQLFTLSYDGRVNKISLPFSEIMMAPEFHPDGKRLLMIKGLYDSDIVRLPLNQIAATNSIAETKRTDSYSSFERTNLGENFAMFQPGGELIAFWSERSGEEQLWISDGNSARQLTHFPLDTNISGIDWAADGKSLLVNANKVLTQVFLDSSQKVFSLEYPVAQLYQWNSESNSAILLIRVKGILKFVEYDLNNSQISEIIDKKILWALKSDDGGLIYKDHMDRFWKPGPVEDLHIKALDNQGGKTKSFIIKGNVIYAVNNENQLWGFDLDNETLKVLGQVSENVDHLTDINDTQLLMTIRVSAKKEVVELSLSK